MKEIITLIFLLLNSWKDWKQKEILPVSVLLYGMLGIGYSLWQGRQILDFGIPVAISLLFLVLSIWTREKIGLGDGLFQPSCFFVKKVEKQRYLLFHLCYWAMWENISYEEKQMQKNKYKKGKFYDRGCLCDVTGAFYFNRIALFMFFCT